MPDKKLTDSEIVKALECCADEGTICRECCFLKESECIAAKSKSALDLVNRLQAKNENLENQATTLTKSISELTNEIERQRKDKEDAFLFAADIVAADKMLKAEEYKECIARVNEIITENYNKHIFDSNDLNDEEKDAVINFSDDVTYAINNLLNEKTGESLQGENGKRGAMGICPVCNESSGMNWDSETDISSCACGWNNAESKEVCGEMKEVLIKFLFGLFILFFSFAFIMAINLAVVSFFYTETLIGKIIGLLLFVGSFWGVCWLGQIVLDSIE